MHVGMALGTRTVAICIAPKAVVRAERDGGGGAPLAVHT